MHTIETERLRLQVVTLDVFDLCLAGNRAEAERLAGVTIADDWMCATEHMKMRRDQLLANPAYGPWCARMIVLKATNRMIGRIGFHTLPDPEALRVIAPGSVEFGYEIYEAFRRRGYAKEAAIGLMRWASVEKGITAFVVSISPENLASQSMAKSLGFVKVGEQIDEVDGPEDVLLLQGKALGRPLSGNAGIFPPICPE